MPTVPGVKAQLAGQYDKENPTPEQLLITAGDMKQRGQLYEGPTTIGDPRAPLKLPSPGGGRGTRGIAPKSKRR